MRAANTAGMSQPTTRGSILTRRVRGTVNTCRVAPVTGFLGEEAEEEERILDGQPSEISRSSERDFKIVSARSQDRTSTCHLNQE